MRGKFRSMFNRPSKIRQQDLIDSDAVSDVEPQTQPSRAVSAVINLAQAVSVERAKRERQFAIELAEASKNVVARLLRQIDINRQDIARLTNASTVQENDSVVLILERNGITPVALNEGVRHELSAQDIAGSVLVVQKEGKIVVQYWPQATSSE